jgi:four helix bundle protein
LFASLPCLPRCLAALFALLPSLPRFPRILSDVFPCPTFREGREKNQKGASMKKLFALELAVEFYQASRGLRLPVHLRDQYLRDQYLRASSSIAMNLAEGSAKATVADRKKYYRIALGSLRECQTILRLEGASEDLFKRADFLGACVYRLCQG